MHQTNMKAYTIRSLAPDRFRAMRASGSLFLAVPTLVIAACSFEPPPDVPDDDDRYDAAVEPDVMPVECEAGSIVCDDALGRYIECGPGGVSTRIIDCPLGCATDAEICLDVAPSNGLAGYLDQARDDLDVVAVTFTGSSTMNTDTGDVTSAGVPITIPSATANGIRVFMFKDVDVPGTLKITGSAPIALLADGDITITGLVDVSADGATNAPGAIQSGACVGSGQIGATEPTAGGGGAGRFQIGGNGGRRYNTTTDSPGGATSSDADLDPLVGGCQGGQARRLVVPTPASNGGGGGGAVQLVARGAVTLGAGGTIDASGGGGGNGVDAGPGGGSGGSVLIEAPSIMLDGPGVVISTKGGSGSGARSSNISAPGADGGTAAAPAAGGALSGHAAGGAGGTETTAPGNGATGNSAQVAGGGGGGSVGEARFNNRSAAITPAGGAAIRSHYSVGTIGSRHMQL